MVLPCCSWRPPAWFSTALAGKSCSFFCLSVWQVSYSSKIGDCRSPYCASANVCLCWHASPIPYGPSTKARTRCYSGDHCCWLLLSALSPGQANVPLCTSSLLVWGLHPAWTYLLSLPSSWPFHHLSALPLACPVDWVQPMAVC